MTDDMFSLLNAAIRLHNDIFELRIRVGELEKELSAARTRLHNSEQEYSKTLCKIKGVT